MSRLASAGRLIAYTAAFVCLPSLVAWAHFPGGKGDASIFYAGIFEILRYPTSLLPVLCLGLWVGQQAKPQATQVGVGFVSMLLVGILMAVINVPVPLMAVGALLSLVVFGAMLALEFRGPYWLALWVALFFGCCHGYVNAEGIAGRFKEAVGYGMGLVFASCLVMFYSVLFARRFRMFAVQIALRVLGSWVAAGGMLVLAMQLHHGTR